MQNLTLEQTADYLQTADIQYTMDSHFSLTHIGINAAGVRFVLINDIFGETFFTESR